MITLFQKKKKEQRFSFGEQLDSWLCFNRRAQIVQEGEDFVLVKIALDLTPVARICKIVLPIREYKKYLISDFSFRFFQMIRQRPRQLRELVCLLRDTEKLSFFEARAFMVQYAADLMRRGLAAVEIVPEHGDNSAEPTATPASDETTGTGPAQNQPHE